MKRLGQLLLASTLAWLPSGTAWAEVVDQSRTIAAAGSIGAIASMTVTANRISDNGINSLGLQFGAVTGVTTAAPWKVAPQYLRVQHSSNAANWAIRILTNNKASSPTLAGKVLNARVIADPNDDVLGYAGLIGSAPADPNDRVSIAWQVHKDVIVGGPASPVDDDGDAVAEANEVGGLFNAPWAFIADASDCPSTSTNCRSVTPDTIAKTIEYLRIAQGDSSNAFLLLHPETAPRTSDGDIPVYIAGRFGGAPADSFSATLIVELYHL